MGYYSPSRLSDYVQCPLKYRFAYIDKIKKDEEGIEAFNGTCVHTALERMLVLSKEYDREPSYELAEELYLKAWDEAYHPGVIIRRADLTLDDYKRRGLMMLRNYFDIEAGQEFGRLLDLEKRLNFQLGENSIGGKIDRVHRDGDTIHIIDYKTSRGQMSQEDADSDRQLGLYELGIRQEFPDAEAVELHWYMLGHTEVVTSVRDEETRRRLAESVCRLADEIESTTDFRPCESRLCGWCEYQEECAEEKRKRTLKPEPEQVPTACDLADEYAELSGRRAALNSEVKGIEKRLEELKPMIGAACREEGAWSVEGTECVLDVAEKLGIHIPPKNTPARARLEALVRDSGLWDEVSEISKGLVQKALEEGRFGDISDEVGGAFDQREAFKIDVRPRE